MLIAIWHMGSTGRLYDDPGADYFNRLHPERAKKRAIHVLPGFASYVCPVLRVMLSRSSDIETDGLLMANSIALVIKLPAHSQSTGGDSSQIDQRYQYHEQWPDPAYDEGG